MGWGTGGEGVLFGHGPMLYTLAATPYSVERHAKDGLYGILR